MPQTYKLALLDDYGLQTPRRRVIGLSKIPRLVDVFARRLQIQERMTNEIAQVILEKIEPRGVALMALASRVPSTRRMATPSTATRVGRLSATPVRSATGRSPISARANAAASATRRRRMCSVTISRYWSG